MAKKPTRPRKPRPPKAPVIVEQPVEQEVEIVKKKLFEGYRSKIAFIGTLFAASASMFTLATHWDNFDLPRLAFHSEVKNVNKQIVNLEVEFRQRAKRNDQKSIYEIEEKINLLKEKHKEIPDELLHQRDRLIEDAKLNEEKLDRAIKKLNN